MNERWVYHIACLEADTSHRLSPLYDDIERAKDFGRQVKDEFPHWNVQLVGEPAQKTSGE